MRSWDYGELSEAFSTLVVHGLTDVRLCIFIDGLDEYNGNHQDVINVLKQCAASPDIKLCVSSRPWNTFIDSFGGDSSQMLRLEDLTKEDIRTYVGHELEQNPMFVQLRANDA